MWDFKKQDNLEHAAKCCEALLNFDVAVQNYWNDRESTKPEFLESLSQMIDASIELQKYMEKKMTRDEIIRMAIEAGAVERYFGNQLHGIAFHKKEWLERFAALVAAYEREKCAEICDYFAGEWEWYTDTAVGLATRIREIK